MVKPGIMTLLLLKESADNSEDFSVATDDELIARISLGDKTAFTGFLNRHLSAIVDFAGRYVGQKSDAEDIAQDTFLRVWHKASSWRSEGASLRSWLYRIAYNLCIDNLRRRRYDMDIDEMELQIDSHGPEETVSNQAQSRRLVIALAALPERQRTALTLCAYHGLSNKEAAVVMDINVEALESLLSRARRKLRKSLILDTGGPS